LKSDQVTTNVFKMNTVVRIKRVYEEYSKSDGFRILVDRLWPRGLTKQVAQVDLWMKEIAPSNDLRKWYHQDMTQWALFRKKYLSELKHSNALADFKSACANHKVVTLLYGSKDEEHNHARILVDILKPTTRSVT
jgi:uncharacterized protein YeaO (DUF488 family)